MRPVRDKGGAEAVEYVDRYAVRILVAFDHDRWHGADEHGLCDPALRAVACNVAGYLAAAGRMADMHGVSQVQVLDERSDVGGIRIHLVSMGRLRGTSVSAPIVSDHAKSFRQEIHQLRIPVVGRERPTVVEYQRSAAAPVFVEDLCAVSGLDEWHGELRTNQGRAS